LIQTRSLWSANYKYARSRDIPILIVSTSIYEDDFVIKMGSRYGQSVLMYTILEAPLQGPRLQSLGTQILMLVNSKGTKSLGDSVFWGVYTSEVEDLAKGKLIEIDGEETMVFAHILLLNGDTPGVKRMMGFSTASTNNFPCPLCTTRYAELSLSVSDPEVMGRTRTKEDISTLFALSDDDLNNALADSCMTERSIIFTWPGQGDPARMVIDLMHALCLGTSRKFFLEVFEILTTEKTIEMRNIVWKQMSDIFTEIAHGNPSTMSGAFTTFKDKQSFKTLTAWSMKLFVQLSPHILRALEIVPQLAVTSRDRKKLDAMEAWCRYIKVEEILFQHDISKDDLRLLRQMIPQVMQWWAINLPAKLVKKKGKEKLKKGFITLKGHYFIHLVNQIVWWGPLVRSSNFGREGAIGKIKPLFYCTNHMHREMQVFRQYRIIQFFEVLEMLNGTSQHQYMVNSFPPTASAEMTNNIVQYLRSMETLIYVEATECPLLQILSTRTANFYLFEYLLGESRVNHRELRNHSLKAIHKKTRKRKNKKVKVAAVDDCITMAGNTHIPEPHTGYFLCVIKHRTSKELYIMYQLPEDDNAWRNEHTYLHVHEVSVAVTKTIIIAPLNNFLERPRRILNKVEECFTLIV
jgi:hypothetical protein